MSETPADYRVFLRVSRSERTVSEAVSLEANGEDYNIALLTYALQPLMSKPQPRAGLACRLKCEHLYHVYRFKSEALQRIVYAYPGFSYEYRENAERRK